LAGEQPGATAPARGFALVVQSRAVPVAGGFVDRLSLEDERPEAVEAGSRRLDRRRNRRGWREADPRRALSGPRGARRDDCERTEQENHCERGFAHRSFLS
jgi:hypothetical protein